VAGTEWEKKWKGDEKRQESKIGKDEREGGGEEMNTKEEKGKQKEKKLEAE